jgi:hypothetical protein
MGRHVYVIAFIILFIELRQIMYGLEDCSHILEDCSVHQQHCERVELQIMGLLETRSSNTTDPEKGTSRTIRLL